MAAELEQHLTSLGLGCCLSPGPTALKSILGVLEGLIGHLGRLVLGGSRLQYPRYPILYLYNSGFM